VVGDLLLFVLTTERGSDAVVSLLLLFVSTLFVRGSNPMVSQ